MRPHGGGMCNPSWMSERHTVICAIVYLDGRRLVASGVAGPSRLSARLLILRSQDWAKHGRSLPLLSDTGKHDPLSYYAPPQTD